LCQNFMTLYYTKKLKNGYKKRLKIYPQDTVSSKKQKNFAIVTQQMNIKISNKNKMERLDEL